MSSTFEDIVVPKAMGWSPPQARRMIREGEWSQPTVGLAHGYVQANLAVVPKEDAYDFLLFCVRNPKPCPLIEVTDIGSTSPSDAIANESDISTDIPRYRVFKNGEVVDEPLEVTSYWRKDLVAFLLGCSLTFEHALKSARVPLRHLDAGRTCPVYVTNRDCFPAGKFRGPLVVSMRPIPGELVSTAIETTSRYRYGHGAPMHVGNPQAIGIEDLSAVDYGDPPVIMPGDVPVFWGCGVTPQLTARQARPQIMITHYPEHMYITDLPSEATTGI